MELLSEAFDSAPTEPSSIDPQKEPILVEIIDASTTAKNVSFVLDARQSIFFNFLIYSVFHPSPDFLPCQILPEETPIREQEPNNSLVGIEGDPVAIDSQTGDSLVRHTTDGKEVICSFYPSEITMN